MANKIAGCGASKVRTLRCGRNQKPQAAERLGLRLDVSKETNQIVAKIHLREARSKGHVGLR